MISGLRGLLAGLVIFAPLLACAHIGDNLAQLREVYGATGKVVANTMIFQRNGYSICVYFDGDTSAMEVFTRDGSEKSKTDITQRDIDDILVLEGQGMGWNAVTSRSGKPTWLRADAKLIARLDPGDTPGDKVFVVMANEK
jgi:hypothetical protein